MVSSSTQAALLNPRIVCYSEKPLTFAERRHRKEDVHNIYAYVMLVSQKVKYSGHQVHCHLIASDINLKAIKKMKQKKQRNMESLFFFFLPLQQNFERGPKGLIQQGALE